MCSCGIWHNTWDLGPCGLFFILQLVCYYPDPLLGFDITWDFMPGHQSFLMPSCSGIFDTLGTGTPKWFISIKMTHCLFRCVQLASKWLFVSLPDHTTFGNQSLLFFVVGKENIDCNRNQVSIDEWVLVSCRSSSPVTVSTSRILPLWHWCGWWQSRANVNRQSLYLPYCLVPLFLNECSLEDFNVQYIIDPHSWYPSK